MAGWRIRSLPTQQNLKSAAIQIGCSYEQILDAALHDAGYLGADRATAADSTSRTAGAALIHNVIVSESYSGRADNRVHEWARGPGIWTMAHRGYSGYRRLDLWAYPTKLPPSKPPPGLAWNVVSTRTRLPLKPMHARTIGQCSTAIGRRPLSGRF